MGRLVLLVMVGLRFVLGVLFVAAGVAKVGRRGVFVEAVRGYQMLPPSLVGVVGVGLPWLEVGVGVLLIAGVGLPVVGVVTAGLLVVFAYGMAVNLWRGRRIDCGCRGAGVGRRISWPLVGRNLVLAAAALAVAVAQPGLGQVAVQGGGVVSVGDGLAVWFIVTVGVLAVALTAETVRFWKGSATVLRGGEAGS